MNEQKTQDKSGAVDDKLHPIVGQTFKVELVSGAGGKSLYLDDHRICGEKPWGGGRMVETWQVRGEDLMAALNQHQG